MDRGQQMPVNSSATQILVSMGQGSGERELGINDMQSAYTPLVDEGLTRYVNLYNLCYNILWRSNPWVFIQICAVATQQERKITLKATNSEKEGITEPALQFSSFRV